MAHTRANDADRDRPNAFWRCDDLENLHHTLVVAGHVVATTDHINHTLTLASETQSQTVAIPLSMPLFEATEQRLGLRPVAFEDAKSGQQTRAADEYRAEIFREQTPPHTESRAYVQRALNAIASANALHLAPPTYRATPNLTACLAILERDDDRWSDASTAALRAARHHLARLPTDCLPAEKRAHLEVERAQSCLYQVRIMPEPEKHLEIDNERER